MSSEKAHQLMQRGERTFAEMAAGATIGLLGRSGRVDLRDRAGYHVGCL